jgi:hypothetical protein
VCLCLIRPNLRWLEKLHGQYSLFPSKSNISRHPMLLFSHKLDFSATRLCLSQHLLADTLHL